MNAIKKFYNDHKSAFKTAGLLFAGAAVGAAGKMAYDKFQSGKAAE